MIVLKQIIKNKLKRICDFEITAGVNENLKADLIILDNCQNIELFNNLSVPVILCKIIKNFQIDNVYDEDFNNTKGYLISTRKKRFLIKTIIIQNLCVHG